MTEDDYKVYPIPLAGNIKAAVMMGDDDFFSIYVNANLPFEVQREAVKHEMRHIRRNDFLNDLSIREVESES